MNVGWAGRRTVRMEEVDSTNETAKKYACQGAENGTLIVAERQTAGKGRRGRSWEGRSGESLLMSLLVRPDFSSDKASCLTLLTAMAVCRAAEAELADGQAEDLSGGAAVIPRIKWPNDVILGTRKVCGILTELIFDGDGKPCVIIGVGVNVNNRSFSDELRDKATSLYLETGRQMNRERLMRRIWSEFEQIYEIFVRIQDFSELKEEYEDRLANRGCYCRLLYEGSEQGGVAVGIDDCGRLQIRTDGGTVLNVDAGEVSVRGIYGYV